MHIYTSIHQGSVKCFFLFAFASCLYLVTLVELNTTRISCSVLKIFPCSDGGRMLEHTVISSSGCSAIFALSGMTFLLFFFSSTKGSLRDCCSSSMLLPRGDRLRPQFCCIDYTVLLCQVFRNGLHMETKK